MIFKKKISAKYLLWLLGFLCLGFVLFLRFKESITRAYSSDEFYHLHAVYHIYRGKLIYRDFFNIYTPILYLTLYPIFAVLGEQFLVLTLSRTVIFIFFLITLFFTYKISRKVTTPFLSFLTVIVLASSVMMVEKGLEIRPDNLMIPFFLGGLFYCLKALEKSPKKNFFISGVFFMLSLLTIHKVIFSIFGFIMGVFVLYLSRSDFRKNIKKGWPFFVLGSVMVFVIFSIILILLGVYIEALQSIFIYSLQIISGQRFNRGLSLFFWLKPNSAVYGTYKGVPWYSSMLFLTLAVFGGIITFMKAIIGRKVDRRTVLLFLFISSFLYLFLVPRVYQQYLLGFLIFIPFFAVFTIEEVFNLCKKRFKFVKYILVISIFFILALSMWKSWQVKKGWVDTVERKYIKKILEKTSRDEIFWGGDGYIFTLDGYYNTNFVEAPISIKWKFPPLVETLKKNNTKYIMYGEDQILNDKWPISGVEMRPLREWVKEDFVFSKDLNLWVRKEK